MMIVLIFFVAEKSNKVTNKLARYAAKIVTYLAQGPARYRHTSILLLNSPRESILTL